VNITVGNSFVQYKCVNFAKLWSYNR